LIIKKKLFPPGLNSNCHEFWQIYCGLVTSILFNLNNHLTVIPFGNQLPVNLHIEYSPFFQVPQAPTWKEPDPDFLPEVIEKLRP
jgi:hypothetical protein